MAAATLPTIVFTDSPRARYNDPDTSHQAADSNTNRELVQEHVLELFRAKGAMTDWELTKAYLADDTAPVADWDSPRKRRSDLVKNGSLVATTERRPGRSGRMSIVYTIAEVAA